MYDTIDMKLSENEVDTMEKMMGEEDQDDDYELGKIIVKLRKAQKEAKNGKGIIFTMEEAAKLLSKVKSEHVPEKKMKITKYVLGNRMHPSQTRGRDYIIHRFKSERTLSGYGELGNWFLDMPEYIMKVQEKDNARKRHQDNNGINRPEFSSKGRHDYKTKISDCFITGEGREPR